MEGKEYGLNGNSPFEGGGGGAGEGGGGGAGPGRELTTREVNRLMRAERKATAAFARAAKRRKYVGVWADFVREAHAKHKGLTAQVDHVFGRVTVRSLHGRDRDLSDGTVDKKHKTIVRSYLDLSVLPEGRGVPKIGALRRKHVVALVKHWADRGLSASTITNRISDLRDWLDRIGKPDTIPLGNEWEMALRSEGVDTRALRRTTIAQAPKDWVANGVDPIALIEKVWAECEVVGAQLYMQLFFGARVREGYSCNPFLDQKGDIYYFDKGTKGGRARSVKLDDDPVMREAQLAVLERVKAVAAKHPKRHLARKGDTAKETRNHFYYVLRKHGITRKEMGITAHGLRHQYLQKRYSDMTGLPAPVHNAVPARFYRELEEREKAARQLTSEEAGHWRPDISAAYLATVPALEKRQKENITANLALLEGRADVDQLFREFGATGVYFIGAAAEGLHLKPGARYALTVLVNEAKGPGELRALTDGLQALTGKPFAISFGFSEFDLPSDRLEVVLLSQRNPPAPAA